MSPGLMRAWTTILLQVEVYKDRAAAAADLDDRQQVFALTALDLSPNAFWYKVLGDLRKDDTRRREEAAHTSCSGLRTRTLYSQGHQTSRSVSRDDGKDGYWPTGRGGPEVCELWR